MSQNVKGTFSTSPESDNSAAGLLSDVLVIPFGTTAIKLSASPLDASNTVQTQKSLDNGQSWANQVTYNTTQTGTSIPAVHGEQWRLVGVVATSKAIDYSLSAES